MFSIQRTTGDVHIMESARLEGLNAKDERDCLKPKVAYLDELEAEAGGNRMLGSSCLVGWPECSQALLRLGAWPS